MALPSSSRNGQRVRLVVLHTAEGAQTTPSLFSYFNRTQTASSHVGIDDAGISALWVPYDRAAWTLRGGNSYSENAEMCAWAKWSRAEWLMHDALLSHAATWVRSRCLARDIPIVKLSPAEVKAGKAGVCGHADYTLATGDGTHTDPGPNFPWDIVISRARNQQKDWMDMATPQEIEGAVETGVMNALGRFVASNEVRWNGRNWADNITQQTGSQLDLQDKLEETNNKLDALIAAVQALEPAEG